MSMRLQILQVARLAPKLLGESAPLVRDFFSGQLTDDGAGRDRDANADLYYTVFALGGLVALQGELPVERVEKYLRTFGDGAALDLIHLAALARCWATIGCERMPPGTAQQILNRIERYRAADGGYDGEVDARFGNAYGCFVALGAYEDLQTPIPEPARIVQCLKFLETPDGAWANARGLKIGSTNATTAAVTVLCALQFPVAPSVGSWLLARAHTDGGFLAMPAAPLPDLLSTATTLHALAAMEINLSESLRERCLDFIDTLWNARGGFHGHWADDDLDAEYTFYGLLALGHLSL